MTVELSETSKLALTPTRGLATVARAYAVSGVEVRAKSEASTIVDFVGHASVYDKGYEMYGGPDKGGWTEFVDAGAGKKTLSENPDVALKLNHEGMTLARTKSGTLQLSEDKIGLATRAQLDTRQSIVNDVVIGMERGDLDEMSFAFRIIRQEWRDADGNEVPWWDLSGIERHITEYSLHKGDVSIVNYGASPHTDAGMRSLEDAIRSYVDADEIDVDTVRRSIDQLQELLPAETPDAERLNAYYAGLRALHDKRAINL